MRLEWNSVTFEKGEHELCCVDFGVILLKQWVPKSYPYVLEDW